jgi:hypothetical protein
LTMPATERRSPMSPPSFVNYPPTSNRRPWVQCVLQAIDIQETSRARRIVAHKPRKRKQDRRSGKSERSQATGQAGAPTPPPPPPTRGQGGALAAAQRQRSPRYRCGEEEAHGTPEPTAERVNAARACCRSRGPRPKSKSRRRPQHQRQHAALRIINTAPRWLLKRGRSPCPAPCSTQGSSRPLAPDADAQGYSFTGPEAAELKPACAKRAEEVRASACSRRYALQKALASTGQPAISTDDFELRTRSSAPAVRPPRAR